MKQLTEVPVVYLAGGMRSDWQDAIKAALPGFIYLDPRDHHHKEEALYTAWDLAAVRRCDIVFGYIERDNPNGAGLALEFGYAAAHDKTLLYVEDPGFPHTRYFGMVRAIADGHFNDMEAALNALGERLGKAPDLSAWRKFAAGRLQAA